MDSLATATSKATSFALPIYLVFLVAAIIGGIYMLMYRRRINKALRENNGRHINMPDARSVIIVILFAVLLFGVYRTKYLVEQSEENLDSLIYWSNDLVRQELEQEIQYLQGQIQELVNASKMVNYYDFSLENCDIENGVATYKLEIILKAISDDTKVSVNIDDKSIELTRDSQGKFTGNVDVNMYKCLNVEAYVFITQGGITTTESLGLVALGEAWKQYLPTIAAKAPYGWEYSNKKIKLNEKLEIYFEAGTEAKFVDAHLEICLAGYDTERVDIDFIESQTAYSVSLEEHLPEVYPLSKLDVYVVGVDSLGNTHKALVGTWREEMWIPCDVYEEMEMEEKIYDKDGNLLTSGTFVKDNN